MQGKKPLNIAIGRRIQQSREQAGLTHEELAERIDRSTQFISTIERGLAGPSLETVIHLCEVLGTSTEWILRGRALLPDSNLLAASVMEKLSGLSPAQLLLVDRMTSDHNEVAQPTEIQKQMVQELSERAARVHAQLVDPGTDNMLKITSDGRKLGLDQRIINPDLPDDPNSKVNRCVDNIHRIWQDGQADRLTQLVFCDLSTPKTGATGAKAAKTAGGNLDRSEERRVGKECRSRWSPYH